MLATHAPLMSMLPCSPLLPPTTRLPNSVHLRVLDGSSYGPEQQELALESLLEFTREPALMTDVYINYDCDVQCTNLFETICHSLSTHALPRDGMVSSNFAGAPQWWPTCSEEELVQGWEAEMLWRPRAMKPSGWRNAYHAHKTLWTDYSVALSHIKKFSSHDSDSFKGLRTTQTLENEVQVIPSSTPPLVCCLVLRCVQTQDPAHHRVNFRPQRCIPCQT